jgi:hypothetical protein
VTSVERETPLTADDVPVATPEELGDAIDKHTTKARRLNAEVVEFDFVATLDGQTHTSDQVNVIYESLATNFIDLGSKISAASQLRPGARVLGWTVRHLLSTVLPWTNVVLKKKNKAPCDAGELGATLSAVVMLGASRELAQRARRNRADRIHGSAARGVQELSVSDLHRHRIFVVHRGVCVEAHECTGHQAHSADLKLGSRDPCFPRQPCPCAYAVCCGARRTASRDLARAPVGAACIPADEALA